MIHAIPMYNPIYKIHTNKCIIRCYRPSDAQSLKEAIDESLEHLIPRMPWAAQEPETIEQKKQRLRTYRGKFDLDQDYYYGIFDKDNTTLIWSSWLHTRLWEWSLEIWYRIRSSYCGKGYATHVSQALTKTWFEKLWLKSIEIHCDTNNIASSKVAQKSWYTLHSTTTTNALTKEALRKKKYIWKLFKEQYMSDKYPFCSWFDAAWVHI